MNSNNDKNKSIISRDDPTQATLNDTEEILKEILGSLEQVNFQILMHPRREEIQKRLEKIEHPENSSEEVSENKSSSFRNNIESMLEDITLKERDYKVLAVEQIVKKSKSLYYPMAFRKEAIYIYNGKYWDICPPDRYANFLEFCFLRLGVPLTVAKDAIFLKKGLDQFERAAHIK
jgi:hypothetical protein